MTRQFIVFGIIFRTVMPEANDVWNSYVFTSVFISLSCGIFHHPLWKRLVYKFGKHGHFSVFPLPGHSFVSIRRPQPLIEFTHYQKHQIQQTRFMPS